MAKTNFKLQSVLRAYFSFSKDQRRAFKILGVIIIILVIGPKLYQYLFVAKIEKADTVIIEASKTLIAKQDDKSFEDRNSPKDFANYSQKENNNSVEINTELFYFDPNIATTADWQKLGLKPKTINTIQNYLSKGGKFRKPEDLAKIYGLSQNHTDKLMPYVRIKNNTENKPVDYANNSKTAYDNNSKKFEKNNAPKNITVDIATADTTAFIALPGIGSKLAARIVNYRTKLGGFYSINQLGETYGLPDTTFQFLKNRLTVSNAALTKIPLNTATAQQIKHPYLSWNIANAIIAYRNQHGAFAAVADVKKILIIDEATYEKIEPYLSLY